MNFSNCNDSITNIAQKLTNIVMNESECLLQNSTSYLGIPAPFLPDHQGSTENCDVKMANCKLELIFLKGVTWLKHLTRTTNYVSVDELKKMLYPLGARELSQEAPKINSQDQNLRINIQGMKIQAEENEKPKRKRRREISENMKQKSGQLMELPKLIPESRSFHNKTGIPSIPEKNLKNIHELMLNSDCNSQELVRNSQDANSCIIINDNIHLSQSVMKENQNNMKQNFLCLKKRSRIVETTPQRPFQQLNINLNIQRNVPRIISTIEQESSQQSPDMFESQSQPEIGQNINYADSGMESMLFPPEPKPIEQNDEPPIKKPKQGFSVVSAEVLLTFMEDEPINNLGLQVVRGLLSALERKDVVKNCLDIFEEMSEAVDTIIDFINSTGNDELEFSGYISFCIPAAVETIQRVCVDLDYSDIEQSQRLCHVQIILELCNSKEICRKTIELFIRKIKGLIDFGNKPIVREIKMKIMWISRCLQLAIEKYSIKFLEDRTTKKVNLATELWRQRWGKNDASENKRKNETKIEETWGTELKIIYIETKNIFPRFAHLMKDMSRIFVTQQA